MRDYIPDSDADLKLWLRNFLNSANANLAALGLVAADLEPIAAAADTFDITIDKSVTAQAGARAAIEDKASARAVIEALVRPLARRLQATETIKDSHRQALGLNIRSTSRTLPATPTTRPVGTIDTSQRLQHTLSFVDENTPSSRAKPDGVAGCEIWVKVGDVPVDPTELAYLATDTRTPYTAVFDGADAGKIAHYMLRWVNKRGERGPWSQTVSATITA